MHPNPADLIALFVQILRDMHLPENSIDAIREKVSIGRLKSGEVLLPPGKVCTHAWLVLQGGFVCRYINDELEVEKTINFYLDDFHPFMACVDSFFTQTPTQCELRAITDSVVIAMPKKQINELIAADPLLQRFYDDLVMNALVEENDLKLKIIAYPSERLYAYLQEHFSSVIRKVPSRYIAELMGITPEWLSKIRKKRRVKEVRGQEGSPRFS
jgi:CRP-like cAMP-binding protein